jgi:hypothetical protein
MNISVSYSFDDEVSRVYEVGQNLDWYLQNGYKPLLPQGITYETIASLSKLKIIAKLTKVFREDDYAAAKHELMRHVEKHHVPFGEKLTTLDLPVEPRYEVILTKYGVGGSYRAPKTVILNMMGKTGIGPIKTVMHEITHMVIQPLIEQYMIPHFEKERVVDLIMSRIAPFDPPIMQTLAKEVTDKVDPVFAKHYPNIEAMLKELKGE